jgi:tetratricopeptide (TPR) repeat protein
MSEPRSAPLLIDYLDSYRQDNDLDAFHQKVMARYTEGTLCRLLRSGNPAARRASALALGLVGSFNVNTQVGEALKDRDPIVRSYASQALWAIWFRADSPENNAALQEVRDLILRGRFRDAEQLATRLIARAPQFAEAFNQRAIALFSQGRYVESAADCQRVLRLNSYHIGALGGLAQCYLRLGNREGALESFRQALRLQPFEDDLRQTIAVLEAER